MDINKGSVTITYFVPWYINFNLVCISITNNNYIPLKPYFKDIYCVINLISHSEKVLGSYNPVYWVITTCSKPDHE